MINSQKLALRLSELRQKLNELSAKDELTEAEQDEMRSLSGAYPKLEERHRAAIISESTEEAAALDEDGDGEDRERRELRSRCKVGRYVTAALDGLPVQGPEAELSAAAGCPGSVPLELFETRREATEHRAVTPAPATTDETLAPIVPAIFDRSAAAWLGIEMPMVGTGDAGYPVLSTSVTGGAVAKSAQAVETAGAFTVTMAQPRRISGAFKFTVEDAARLSGMEAALRANIASVLSDELDKQAINGSGTGDGTLNGLLNILTDPTAPAANAESFARYVAAAASHVDGLFAVDLGGVRQLVGVQTYGHMGGGVPGERRQHYRGGLADGSHGRRADYPANSGARFRHSTGDREAGEPGRGPRGRHAGMARSTTDPGPVHGRTQGRDNGNRADAGRGRDRLAGRRVRAGFVPAGVIRWTRP